MDVRFSETEPPVGADAPPEAVALAVLDAMREAQLSRADGLGSPEKKEQYERAMAKLRTLIAAQEVHAQVLESRSPLVPRDVTQEAAVTLAAESWVSLVAHYVEGYKLDTLQTSILVPESFAVSYVNAENPRDAANLRSAVEENGGTTTRPSDAAIHSVIARGTPPAAEAGIEMRMKYVDGAWRVNAIALGLARPLPLANPSF